MLLKSKCVALAIALLPCQIYLTTGSDQINVFENANFENLFYINCSKLLRFSDIYYEKTA